MLLLRNVVNNIADWKTEAYSISDSQFTEWSSSLKKYRNSKTCSNLLNANDTRVPLLNCRSIRKKVQSKMQLISDNSIDIALFTEIWLGNNYIQITLILSANPSNLIIILALLTAEELISSIIPALLVRLILIRRIYPSCELASYSFKYLNSCFVKIISIYRRPS